MTTMKNTYYKLITLPILLFIIILINSNIAMANTSQTNYSKIAISNNLFRNLTPNPANNSSTSKINDPFFTFGSDPRPYLSTSGYWSWQDYPYSVPYTTPQPVRIFTNVASNDITKPNYPPIITSKIVNLPSGTHSKILLRVDVQLKSAIPGRLASNYDRALWIFVDGTPLFIGTTAQRYNYAVITDVTHLYPLLTGKHNFTFILGNYIIPSLGLTGYFVANVTLLYYPGQPQNPPTDIIPLWTNGTNNLYPGLAWTRLTPSRNIATQNITIPGNLTKAYLLLYTEGAAFDEFWWSNIPTDREVLVYSDNKLIAVTQPFPYIYTGGINPFMWRPIPEINTYAFEPLIIDITPYIPFIIGKHTIKITITNNQNYWLTGGALLLTRTNKPVSYNFLGDNPQLTTNETTKSLPNKTLFNNTMSFTNTATLNMTIGTQTITYKTEYKLTTNALQSYNDIWWNSTLIQSWYYKSNWQNNTETSQANSSLYVNYGEIIQIQGDISKASVSNPVPATFSLIANLKHTYTTQKLTTNNMITTGYTHSEKVTSNSILAGTLVFISPTGAIITGISAINTITTKSLQTKEIENNRQSITFTRYTAGGNYYPPLTYTVFADLITVKW